MPKSENDVKAMLPLLLVLLPCLGHSSAATLDFRRITPEMLSDTVLQLAGNQTAHSQCGEDIRRWLAGIGSEERWAVQMADSWGTSIAGLFHGNKLNLGDFDECIYASSESTKQTPEIKGAYFLPSATLLPSTQGAASSGGKASALLSGLAQTQLRLAFCVPDSCDADLILRALQSVVNAVLLETGSGFSSYLSLPAGKQSLTTLPRPGVFHWIYLSVVIFLALLAFVATILDKTLDATNMKSAARQRWRYLLHFSMISNMRRLLAPAPSGSMKCINGIRVLSTLWIMTGHTIDNFPPVQNSIEQDEFGEGFLARALMRYTLSVDTFLTIAGVVCCISFLRSAEKNGFNWIKYIIRRYARTTPALVMVTLYGATWLSITSPGADAFLGSYLQYVGWFQDYWWASFLHITNFFGNLDRLMCHTWYLSLDMQLYVLAPIVLIPLWKRPFIGKCLLALTTLIACLIPAVLSVIYTARNDTGSGSLNSEYYNYKKMFYFGTQSRMSPYLVGIAAGYFLHQLKFGGLKFHFTKFQAAAIWFLSASLALVVVYAPYSIIHDSASDHPYNAVEAAFFLGFTKLAWGVSIALVIIACETGWGGPVNEILSWSVFTPLGKLSFAIYLVHFFITLIDMLLIVHVVEYFSVYGWIRMLLSSTTMTIPLATLLFLFVEQPFVLIESELWK